MMSHDTQHTPRSMLVTEVGRNDFVIVMNGREMIGQLGADEANFVAARFFCAPPGTALPYQGGTTCESYWEMKRRITEEIMAQLRPVDRLMLQERKRPRP